MSHLDRFLPAAPVQLIYALETSLKTIMEGKVSLEERFKMHRETSVKFKTAMKDMGFKLVSRLGALRDDLGSTTKV
jgi:alanine-glyoxylate transaminase/serine-glyoxylate transaminase/serine-pyruvate transaminase